MDSALIGVVAAGLSFAAVQIRRAPMIAQRPPEDELDVSVEAAQIVVGPALQRIQDRFVDPQEKGLPFSHETSAGGILRLDGYW
jgi:hypothetical protein